MIFLEWRKKNVLVILSYYFSIYIFSNKSAMYLGCVSYLENKDKMRVGFPQEKEWGEGFYKLATPTRLHGNRAGAASVAASAESQGTGTAVPRNHETTEQTDS